MGGWLRALLLLQPIPREFSFRSQAPLHSPGPPMFAEHPGLCSQLAWKLGAGRNSPGKEAAPRLGLAEALRAGISCLLPVPARCCCLAWPLVCSRLSGFATCPSHHSSSVFLWERGMLLPAAWGMLGWHQHHPCTVRDPSVRWGRLCWALPPLPLWSGSFDLGRGHRGAGPR